MAARARLSEVDQPRPHPLAPTAERFRHLRRSDVRKMIENLPDESFRQSTLAALAEHLDSVRAHSWSDFDEIYSLGAKLRVIWIEAGRNGSDIVQVARQSDKSLPASFLSAGAQGLSFEVPAAIAASRRPRLEPLRARVDDPELVPDLEPVADPHVAADG